MQLKGDAEIQARAELVEALLRHVCDDDEFPWFVSDEATLYDVCTLSAEEIVARISVLYRRKVPASDLKRPIWQLVDTLQSVRQSR